MLVAFERMFVLCTFAQQIYDRCEMKHFQNNVFNMEMEQAARSVPANEASGSNCKAKHCACSMVCWLGPDNLVWCCAVAASYVQYKCPTHQSSAFTALHLFNGADKDTSSSWDVKTHNITLLSPQQWPLLITRLLLLSLKCTQSGQSHTVHQNNK